MANTIEFESVFRHCDADGDGKISPKELQHCVKLVCGDLSDREVEEIVSSLDSDGDGLLEIQDFVLLVKGKGEGEKEKIRDLREAFGMYVMDEGECITPKSLKRMLSLLGESRSVDECGVMVNQFDVNGDGVLNFDEFLLMMK